jgi:hypothetical protein
MITADLKSSEWEPLERPGVDMTSTRPGTPGGEFFRRFWLAVARSDDVLPGEAKPIRIMSEDYALYRGRSAS